MSIQQVIENEEFYHVFQPIYEINKWKKIGYEVLFRTPCNRDPEIVFQEADKVNRLFELDTRSIYKAIETFCEQGAQKDGYLFLNIFPSTVVHPDFPSVLLSITKEKNRYCREEHLNFKLVFEIPEPEIGQIPNMGLIKNRIWFMKDQGILVSIGKRKNQSIQFLQEVSPDFLKLDRYYSENLFQSKAKQAYIDMFIKYCDQHNSKLILEGIEKDVQLASAKYIGVQFTQGYLLGRPAGLER